MIHFEPRSISVSRQSVSSRFPTVVARRAVAEAFLVHTSTVKRSDSHHHLNVSTTGWRHLCDWFGGTCRPTSRHRRCRLCGRQVLCSSRPRCRPNRDLQLLPLCGSDAGIAITSFSCVVLALSVGGRYHPPGVEGRWAISAGDRGSLGVILSFSTAKHSKRWSLE